MNTIAAEVKPVAALALSALMGALLVLGSVAMLGASAPDTANAHSAKSLFGISRFNTTDIRIAPMARPVNR